MVSPLWEEQSRPYFLVDVALLVLSGRDGAAWRTEWAPGRAFSRRAFRPPTSLQLKPTMCLHTCIDGMVLLDGLHLKLQLIYKKKPVGSTQNGITARNY